jgi:hypothetical protein
MKRWLQKPESLKIASFWGSVGIVVGFICLLNVSNVTATSINFEPQNGMTNFIAGIILIALGVIIASLAQDKTGWARVGCTTGLSIFFWGIHVFNTYKTGLGFSIGWGAIILGIILLGIGFKLAPGFKWSPK